MSRAAGVYAQGLYELAREEGLEDAILQDLQLAEQAFQESPEYIRLLALHSLSKEERCGLLDQAFRGRVCPYVLNFLKILTEKGYITGFSDSCSAYGSLYDQAHGILQVSAVTAVPLTEDQRRRLTEKLQAITGKTIRLDNPTDPRALGGVRLDYDGKRVDGTVAGGLERIRRSLQDTVL